MDNINESEKILIEFLFDKVGKGKLNNEKKIFTTKDLKNMLMEQKHVILLYQVIQNGKIIS